LLLISNALCAPVSGHPNLDAAEGVGGFGEILVKRIPATRWLHPGDGAALGDNSISTGTDSAALGPNATATGVRSVAIGSGSVASEANVISVGSGGATRRIINVAAGINPTDAVNVSQHSESSSQVQLQIEKLYGRVDGMEKNIKKNTGGVAMGAGTFGVEYAIGVSNFLRLNDHVILSSSIAFQERQVGGRAGLTAAW
jgi:hypothetical protein